ncbi:hypothetical protein [Streptomyces shenzhenensis]|uniref:Cysteine dioxygenase n=1 Tax=Streptomyces shenzhenensis TaxID=943815 RepID=A0A3M0HW48_9ACTN|nr:hypothetical protein [Streptomyces shenzhenensis]RMB81237.1 hypothetical protein CTZ28_36290 [Streptomyces shenzhenensis]
MIGELTKPLHSLNWDDTPAVEAATSKVLTTLADDGDLLRRLVHHVLQDEHLSRLSEHYDILDKVVLHDDPAGWRLRLHVFLPGYYDRPHNHRWTYSSQILRGSYQHTLYGLDDVLNEGMNVAALQPYMVRTEQASDSYTLHHRMIHAAVAEPHTVTLIVRGPALKDRFLVSDRETGRAWWQYGAAKESQDEAERKRMSLTQINQVISDLAARDII